MSETVHYVITGFLNEAIMVKFTLDTASETLTFKYDGQRPIKEFLDEQAVFVMPALRQKARQAPVDLMALVGTTGSTVVADFPTPPQGSQPQFFHEHPDPNQVSKPQ